MVTVFLLRDKWRPSWKQEKRKSGCRTYYVCFLLYWMIISVSSVPAMTIITLEAGKYLSHLQNKKSVSSGELLSRLRLLLPSLRDPGTHMVERERAPLKCGCPVTLTGVCAYTWTHSAAFAVFSFLYFKMLKFLIARIHCMVNVSSWKRSSRRDGDNPRWGQTRGTHTVRTVIRYLLCKQSQTGPQNLGIFFPYAFGLESSVQITLFITKTAVRIKAEVVKYTIWSAGLQVGTGSKCPWEHNMECRCTGNLWVRVKVGSGSTVEGFFETSQGIYQGAGSSLLIFPAHLRLCPPPLEAFIPQSMSYIALEEWPDRMADPCR